MSLFKKFFHVFLVLSLVFQTGGLGAQVMPDFFSLQKKVPPTAEKQLQQLHKMMPQRPEGADLYALLEEWEQTGYVDECAFAGVIGDKEHIASLSASEAETLIFLASSLRFSNSFCQQQITHFLQHILREPYDEKAADFALNGFYVLLAASYARNNRHTFREISSMAYTQVRQLPFVPSLSYQIWPVELLFLLAQESLEEGVYNLTERERSFFEKDLEELIGFFDGLKYKRADFVMRGVKSSDVWNITNQASLISLFIQANSFLSMKDDDSFAKQMFSTGGLNFIGRGDAGRFSDHGEVFYLHHVTPGTDGKGNMADTPGGRSHLALSRLVQALFVSYDVSSTQVSSQKMQHFIRKYFEVDSDGKFTRYLYVPLMGMRLGRILHNESSLYGWDREEEALQKELHVKLKKGYPWSVGCSVVQGSCEVAVEWLGFGELIGGAFKLLGWGAKTTGKQVVKMLPAKALMDLAVVEMAGKAAIKWSKKNIGEALRKYGWKAATAAGAGAVLQADQDLHQVSSY